jgi:hypothetical protein
VTEDITSRRLTRRANFFMTGAPEGRSNRGLYKVDVRACQAVRTARVKCRFFHLDSRPAGEENAQRLIALEYSPESISIFHSGSLKRAEPSNIVKRSVL